MGRKPREDAAATPFPGTTDELIAQVADCGAATDDRRTTPRAPAALPDERIESLLARYAGSMPGVYGAGYLDRLRHEWDNTPQDR